jgi:hypothetical protein
MPARTCVATDCPGQLDAGRSRPPVPHPVRPECEHRARGSRLGYRPPMARTRSPGRHLTHWGACRGRSCQRLDGARRRILRGWTRRGCRTWCWLPWRTRTLGRGWLASIARPRPWKRSAGCQEPIQQVRAGHDGVPVPALDRVPHAGQQAVAELLLAGPTDLSELSL